MSTIQNFADGLAILAKYNPSAEVCAEHDEIWAGGPHPGNTLPKDRKRLEELGFTWDEDTDSWHKFT